MKHKNKFQDGEKVIIKDSKEIVTIDKWGYAVNMKRYVYSIVEKPFAFYFEEELESLR